MYLPGPRGGFVKPPAPNKPRQTQAFAHVSYPRIRTRTYSRVHARTGARTHSWQRRRGWEMHSSTLSRGRGCTARRSRSAGRLAPRWPPVAVKAAARRREVYTRGCERAYMQGVGLFPFVCFLPLHPFTLYDYPVSAAFEGVGERELLLLTFRGRCAGPSVAIPNPRSPW